jgi:hypothetical protein
MMWAMLGTRGLPTGQVRENSESAGEARLIAQLRSVGTAAFRSFGRNARGKWGGDEMGDRRLSRCIEFTDRILDDSICVRQTLVLSQMFKPR